MRQHGFLSRPGECGDIEWIALKGIGEYRVLGLGCGMHTASRSESRLAGYGVLASSPLEKVRDGLVTCGGGRHVGM